MGLLRQNSALKRDVASLRVQFIDQGSKLEQANEVVATLLDPQALKIELVAAGDKSQPRGKAIYQRGTRGLIFLASNLPTLPTEKIYELWLFPANGGPPNRGGLVQTRCSRQRHGSQSSAPGRSCSQELRRNSRTRQRHPRISKGNTGDRRCGRVAQAVRFSPGSRGLRSSPDRERNGLLQFAHDAWTDAL
jgi:hypothetical protein